MITGLHTGGAEILLRSLLNSFDSEKYTYVVVSLLPIGEIGELMKRDGHKVLSIDMKSKIDLRSIWRLHRILRDEKPDIIHAHLFHAIVLGRIMGKLCHRIPVITTIDNVEVGGKIRELILRWTAALSSANTAVCQTVAEEMLIRKIFTSQKYDVIYNAVELQHTKLSSDEKNALRKKLGIPVQAIMLVGIGRLTKIKGFNFLIDAFKEVACSNTSIHLYILGEGPEHDNLSQQIKERSLEERVYLTGNVQNSDEYLQAADVFILPSLWEGLSLALLEAASAGLLLVATSVGGNPEIIVDGVNGFLIPTKDVDKLAEKISYAITLSNTERKRMTKEAVNTVRNHFSISKTVAKYASLYDRLA